MYSNYERKRRKWILFIRYFEKIKILSKPFRCRCSNFHPRIVNGHGSRQKREGAQRSGPRRNASVGLDFQAIRPFLSTDSSRSTSHPQWNLTPSTLSLSLSLSLWIETRAGNVRLGVLCLKRKKRKVEARSQVDREEVGRRGKGVPRFERTGGSVRRHPLVGKPISFFFFVSKKMIKLSSLSELFQ